MKKYNSAFAAVSVLFEELPAIKEHREANRQHKSLADFTKDMPTRPAYEAALARFQHIERELFAIAQEIEYQRRLALKINQRGNHA